jgi:hypothetical protein
VECLDWQLQRKLALIFFQVELWGKLPLLASRLCKQAALLRLHAAPFRLKCRHRLKSQSFGHRLKNWRSVCKRRLRVLKRLALHSKHRWQRLLRLVLRLHW